VLSEKDGDMPKPIEKVMSAPEAIDHFVHDGDHLIIGNYTVGTCMELVFEIVRQGKKGFTLYSQSGILDVELLVAQPSNQPGTNTVKIV
jgi:glutaconate CoA-transferase subunit A